MEEKKEYKKGNELGIKQVFNIPSVSEINNYDIFDITEKNVTAYTHIIHKYPSKFIPQIPRWAITEYSKQGDLILDPFSGSGTTAIESMIYGRNAVALDINPLAVLISKVKTTPIDPNRLIEVYEELIRNYNSDREIKKNQVPNIPNIEKWFTEESIRNLSILKHYIKQINDKDVREFFLVTFSAIIRKTSNAEYRSQKTYISSRFKKEPSDVYKIFNRRFNQYLNGMKDFYEVCKKNNCKSTIFVGSADKVSDIINKNSIDLAITSPPYVTAVEYPAVFKLEYQWLDFFEDNEINEHRKSYIGTDRVYKNEYDILHLMNVKEIDDKLREIYNNNKKKAHIIYKYLVGMENNFKEVHKVLKEGGRYLVVVGNNSVMNIEIELSEFLIILAKLVGFEFEKIFSYKIKDRHLIIPRNGKGRIIEKDWMIVLNKKD